MKLKKGELIFQYKISLLDTKPSVWRRIQVPSGYSFWDLHVAIQDSMGWTDSHLHMFRIRPQGKQKDLRIGIPDDEFDDLEILAGWEIPLDRFFWRPGTSAVYEYDFGDSWNHDVLLEGVLIPEAGSTYPRCLAGENACPPEDCGGIWGYCKSKKNKLLFLFQSCFEIRAAISDMGVLCQLPGESTPKCRRNHIPRRIVIPKGPLECGIFRQLFL